jgi:hypothetical protein
MSKIKKEKYFRDLQNIILSICCAKCKKEVLWYQKEEGGNLERLYLNRILAPEKLVALQELASNKSHLITLKCECGAKIGTPISHRENRLAFKLLPGSFIEQKEKIK